MVSPKDRVKANIYKELFEQEKRKNKRKSLFSVSLFFLGIFTSSTYQMLISETPIESTLNYAINKKDWIKMKRKCFWKIWESRLPVWTN